MSDGQPKQRSEADAELERQIRAERKFSLSEAIAQAAGPGIMKGASPVDRRQQAAAEIQQYLCRHLADSGGVLAAVLLRHVRDSDLLLKHLDEHPLAVLGRYVRRLLASESGLKELVREADVEWGRLFGERPCFENDGQPPAPHDPYTLETVRAALGELAGGLSAGQL
jgi:hypothetical protein